MFLLLSIEKGFASRLNHVQTDDARSLSFFAYATSGAFTAVTC